MELAIEVKVHGDERWQTEVTSNTYFRGVRRSRGDEGIWSAPRATCMSWTQRYSPYVRASTMYVNARPWTTKRYEPNNALRVLRGQLAVNLQDKRATWEPHARTRTLRAKRHLNANNAEYLAQARGRSDHNASTTRTTWTQDARREHNTREVNTTRATWTQHARREHNTREVNTTRAKWTQHARREHNTREVNTTRATWTQHARRELNTREVNTTRANSHSACKTRKLESSWRRRVDAVILFSVALLASEGRKAWHTSAHLLTSLLKEEDEVVSGAEEEERKRSGKEDLEMKRLTHLLRR